MTEKTNPNQNDVWLHKQEGHIHYFVHKPTRHCGIHIRGLAELCGVHLAAIQNALKWAQKGEGGLDQNKEHRTRYYFDR